jgi:hypothetical protein
MPSVGTRTARCRRNRLSRMKAVAKLAPGRVPWTMQELARLTQIQRALVQSGLRAECQHGTTDEGDPFTDFCEERS